MDSSVRYADLRARHPELVYERFTIEERAESYLFNFDFALAGGPRFRPGLSLPKAAGGAALDIKLLENLAFHVGLAESISYWKAASPPVLRIEAGPLSQSQAAWWRNLYYHGLGEFFYLNGLISEVDPNEFIRFLAHDEAPAPLPCSTEGNLVPIGGGKDSLVTLRLLESRQAETACFFLNSSPVRESEARLFGYGPERVIAARRRVDPALLELNGKGYWNGHTPFSALLGFVSVLAAALHGKRYLILSNEASASEPTVPGTEINHQYSKSWAYEQAFSSYVARFLTPSVDYFSLLRPWNELQIARRFAQEEDALTLFRSCNVESRQGTWCGKCSKCLFVDILLLPFLSRERRTAIFGGTTPLQRPELQPIFAELIGAVPVKPFECVGTVEEVRAALTLAAGQADPPALLRSFLENHAALRVAPEKIEALLSGFQGPHQVPDFFLPLLR